MPINYQQTYERIKEIGAGAPERRKKKEEAQELAQNLLTSFDSELDSLRSKVDAAKEADANIRCAVPRTENLASSHPVPDSVPVTLIAADGSQIVPNRHDALQYYVINVGAIRPWLLALSAYAPHGNQYNRHPRHRGGCVPTQ